MIFSFPYIHHDKNMFSSINGLFWLKVLFAFGNRSGDNPIKVTTQNWVPCAFRVTNHIVQSNQLDDSKYFSPNNNTIPNFPNEVK